MAILRSHTIPGQAAALAFATAERAGRSAAERADELRAEGRRAATAELQARVEAAERRAREAGEQAEARVAAIQRQAEERLGRAAATLERALANMSGLEGQLRQEAEAEIVRLAMAVAARVLAREVASDPLWMRGLLQAALNDIPDRRHIELRMAPADAEAVRPLLAEAAANAGADRLDLIPDPNLQPGSCVLAALGTRLDASVSTSWERVARTLVDATPRPPLAADDAGAPVEPSP